LLTVFRTVRSFDRDCAAVQTTVFLYSYHHWNTQLALTWFSRAIRTIDAPGTSASTTRRFTSDIREENALFPRRGWITVISEVTTQ
jgi:hypothetical protein